jgi:hypothetical protein
LTPTRVRLFEKLDSHPDLPGQPLGLWLRDVRRHQTALAVDVTGLGREPEQSIPPPHREAAPHVEPAV